LLDEIPLAITKVEPSLVFLPTLQALVQSLHNITIVTL